MEKFSQMFAVGMASLGLGVASLALFLGVVNVGVQTQVALANFIPQQQTATTVLALSDDYGTASTAADQYPAYCPNLSVTLQKGSRDASTGGQVTELQHFISGYYNIDPSEIMTGYFGSVTQGFVVQFQKAQNLPSFGIVGSLTRPVIASVCGQSTGGATGATTVTSVTTSTNTQTNTQPTTNTAPIATANTVAAPVLTLSTDASTPSYQVVAGGAHNVVLGVYDFTPSGDNIVLTKIGLKLANGSAGDVSQVYLYSGTNLLGTATFFGGSAYATSTLVTPITIAAGSLQVTVKADISNIGISQPGTSGDLVQVVVANAQGTGQNSGATVNASAQTTSAGVRIFKSYPTVSLVSLPSTSLVNGTNALMRFSVTANAQGSVGVEKFNFHSSQSNAQVSTYLLYVYSDAAYSQGVPVLGNTLGLNGTGSVTYNDPTGPRVETDFNSGAIEIPAGATYYFELRGNVTLGTTAGAVVTTLLGDTTSRPALLTYNPSSPSALFTDFFVWTPNDINTSVFTNADWSNGYGLPGLPASGLSQSRTGTGTTPLPTATIDASSLTSTTGTPTITGIESGAVSVFGISIDNGDKEYGSGNISIVNGHWSVTVTPALPNGIHNVHVYGDNVELAKGTLTITAPVASPILNYVSQTPQAVTVNYSNMPTNAQLSFVNSTTGQGYTPQIVSVAGSGSVAVGIGSSMLSGAYYVRALDATGAYLAQTVVFYLNNTTPALTVSLTQSSAQTTSDGTTGQSFTLSWSSPNATACVIQKTAPDGTVTNPWGTQPNGVSGSQVATPSLVGVHHFSIDCIGPAGIAHADVYHTVASSTVPTTPTGTSCSYVPDRGSASTINISGGSDACKAWCSSQALESDVTYSCSYNGVKVADSVDATSLVASAVVAPYSTLVDLFTNMFVALGVQ